MRQLALMLAVAALASVAPSARADVTYVEHTKIKGLGSPGAVDVTRTVRLSGLKECENSVIRYSRPVAIQKGVRSRETADIARLDRDLTWTLDPGGKTYVETTFDAMRAQTLAAAQDADSIAMTAEAPDADPRVEIDPTSDVRRIGPWEARRVIINVSTQVVDLKSGSKRNGWIVWELWMADPVPGVQEIRSFDQIYAEKLGTSSEFVPMMTLGESYRKSVKQAMLALRQTTGYPVEWTWTLRTELSPEELAALNDAAATQRESADEQADLNDKLIKNLEIDPARQAGEQLNQSNITKDLHRPEEPVSGEDAETVSADLGPGVEEGMMVLMKASSTIETVDPGTIDPAIFEIPSGYRNTAPPK